MDIMKPAQVNVLIALFAYSGNGGVASTIPELALWLATTYYKCKTDPRIAKVAIKIYCDTPITMTRNRAVRDAQLMGCDMLLMLDSDNEPDGYLEMFPDQAKPFWDTAFTFAYDRLIMGQPTVIAAPYCGPPPHPVGRRDYEDGGEVPYLFEWSNRESDDPNAGVKLSLMTRNEAAKISGLYPVAALPTGVCLFTLNAFDGIKHPYFEYEYSEDHAEKKSTEDVVATRDISLHWKITKGYDVVWAACDSWALHHKTKKVGRPQFVALESVSAKFAEAIYSQRTVTDVKEYVDYSKNLPDHIGRKGQMLRHDQNEIYLSPEDLEEARILAERERETGSQYADVRIDNDPEPEKPQPVVNCTAEMDRIQAAVEEALEKQNGHALKYRMIAGRKVAAIETEISDESIENITNLTNWLVDKKDGPLEAAVVHAGSGQSSAAILSGLPDGSHLYALDSTLTYQFNTLPSEQFAKSFQPELESGRVMADLAGRKFPYPEDQHHLDLVFIERSLTEDKLETWQKHLTEGGLLAGLGYETPKTRRMVDEFVENNGFKVIASGDVWAIPK